MAAARLTSAAVVGMSCSHLLQQALHGLDAPPLLWPSAVTLSPIWTQEKDLNKNDGQCPLFWFRSQGYSAHTHTQTHTHTQLKDRCCESWQRWEWCSRMVTHQCYHQILTSDKKIFIFQVSPLKFEPVCLDLSPYATEKRSADLRRGETHWMELQTGGRRALADPSPSCCRQKRGHDTASPEVFNKCAI